LVVDNNSRDQTREVVEDFCHRRPGLFRYVFEPQQGKSFALSTGVRESKGDVLAFLDDDVVVERAWLQSLTAALNDGEWAGVGGRTLLAQPYSPPRWLVLQGPYSTGRILAALFDLGDKPCELDRAPYGTNMAFRKKMFEKCSVFRADLGPSPDCQIPRPDEDTEFGRRLMAAGERLRYEPSAIVYHPPPEHRAQKEYLLRWWFDYGRALVQEWGRGSAVLGIPRPYFNILRLGTTVMAERLGRWMLSFNPQKRFYNKCWVWVTAGPISEYYHLARSMQPQKDA